MSAWHSPQSIFSIGHRAVKELFTVPVQIQEKVDGSFFAFGLFPLLEPAGAFLKEVSGVYDLKVRSKGAVMEPDAPQALFIPAVNTVKSIQHLLHPGWQYRGETLAKPKHNALSYDRTPKGNIILFDVLTDEETYLPYEELCAEAKRLDLEVVPQLFAGKVDSADQLRQYLGLTSVLGGQKIEGVVIKPLQPLYDPDKKMLFGKFVSEAFKEVHRKTWGENNLGPRDIINQLADQFKSPARYQKALIHLRERGVIQDSPRDICWLIREVLADILKEHADEIKETLFNYAWSPISHKISKEIPTWYKEQLLLKQFEQETND